MTDEGGRINKGDYFSFIPQPSAFLFTSQQIEDDLLDADDVIGKRILSTRLRSNITIREENGTAALEVSLRDEQRNRIP